jgi:hypothetical protein
VTFGTTQAGHTFKEGITYSGILTWQSKPGQKLSDPQIKRLITHNSATSNIHLLLRTNSSDKKYTYLGKIHYESHNPEEEKPVQFQWQILDWEINLQLFEKIGLILGDPELEDDPYTPKSKYTEKNQLINSGKIPTAKKIKNLATPGSRVVSVDFLNRAGKSKKHGDNGEILVMAYEINKLKNLGIKKDVIHKSKEGDGHGYDIESYNSKGEKIYIEVKTSVGGLNSDFDVSLNEVLVSKIKADHYYLYRLFNYNDEMNSAEFYVLNGPLENNFTLVATQYRASYRVEE